MSSNSHQRDDGFDALWTVVVREARRRLVESAPEATSEFLRAEPELEASPELARQLRLKEPCTKVLEAGVACREAIFRLSTAQAVSNRLRVSERKPGGIESIVLDATRIYLSAYIDAVRKFCDASLGQLVPEDVETRQRRDEVKAWLTAAKKVLSTGRETVAHADTAFISGITDDGLWAPMLLLDALEEGALLEMFKDGIERDAEKFEWRIGQLMSVALLALAHGEAQMATTAALIDRKLPGT